MILVGNPNVGKSVIFNYLTGKYVTVSNYPGTTVEFTRGHLKSYDRTLEVIYVPGTYTLEPIQPAEHAGPHSKQPANSTPISSFSFRA